MFVEDIIVCIENSRVKTVLGLISSYNKVAIYKLIYKSQSFPYIPPKNTVIWNLKKKIVSFALTPPQNEISR